MNGDEIEYTLHGRCRGQFVGVFARDRLPTRLPRRRPLVIVCNTDPHYRTGEHWISMYLDVDSRGEYFDSFGQEPLPIFRRFLDRHCTTWIRNERQLQSVISRFCGHYVIFYCLYRCFGYTMRDIDNCFTTDTSLNDAIVHAIVCRMI